MLKKETSFKLFTPIDLHKLQKPKWCDNYCHFHISKLSTTTYLLFEFHKYFTKQNPMTTNNFLCCTCRAFNEISVRFQNTSLQASHSD